MYGCLFNFFTIFFSVYISWKYQTKQSMNTCSKTKNIFKKFRLPLVYAYQIYWIFLEPQPLILGGFGCCNYLKQSLWLWGLNFIGIMFCGFKGKALQKLIMTIILENFENQHICKIKTQWNAKILWMSQIHSNLPSLSFFKFNFDYWKH